MTPRKQPSGRSLFPPDFHKLYQEGYGLWIFRKMVAPFPKDLDFEVEFCQGVLRRAPDHSEALALLGECLTQRGDYREGLEVDLKLSRLRPTSSLVHYNLACSYALNQEKNKSFEMLKLAIELGYSDLNHLKKDRDLESLRNDPRFHALIERLSSKQGHAQKVEGG